MHWTQRLIFVRSTKSGIEKKDLIEMASKYWRYTRIMKKRGVKRTKGATEKERTLIKKYAKDYVLKSLRDEATVEERTKIDAKIVAIKTAMGEAKNFPEEDEIVERISLLDELREEKEDGEASMKVAGKTTVQEGADFVLEPRSVVCTSEMKAESGSTVVISTGSKMTIGRDDGEVDDEIEDGSSGSDGLDATSPLKKNKKETKMLEVAEGAVVKTEAESRVEVERVVRCDGDFLVSGTIIVQKDDAKMVEEDETEETNMMVVEENTVEEKPKGMFKLADGAELGGVGTMRAKTIEVTTGSVLRPGNSPGTMHMDGDVILDSLSHVQFEIIDTTEDQYDLLHVSGKMLLGGTMNVEAGESCLMPVAVITTQEGLESDFDDFNGGSTVGAAGTKSEDGYGYNIGCSVCEANQHVVKSQSASMGTVRFYFFFCFFLFSLFFLTIDFFND